MRTSCFASLFVLGRHPHYNDKGADGIEMLHRFFFSFSSLLCLARPVRALCRRWILIKRSNKLRGGPENTERPQRLQREMAFRVDGVLSFAYLPGLRRASLKSSTSFNSDQDVYYCLDIFFIRSTMCITTSTSFLFFFVHFARVFLCQAVAEYSRKSELISIGFYIFLRKLGQLGRV